MKSCSLPLPQTFDAPYPYSHRFCPLPSGSPLTSQSSFLRLLRPMKLQHLFVPTCSGLRRHALRLLCHLLTSVCQSHRLSTVIVPKSTDKQTDLPVYCAHTFTPYTRRIYSHVFPNDYWALNLMAFSPRRGCLICASCSSGRGFACRFLQTPPRGGSLCGSANGSRNRGP